MEAEVRKLKYMEAEVRKLKYMETKVRKVRRKATYPYLGSSHFAYSHFAYLRNKCSQISEMSV